MEPPAAPRDPGRRRRAAVLAFLFLSLPLSGLRFAPVRGASMEPALHDGQILCFAPLAPGGLQRGEVVVFRSPLDPSLRYVKRVAGLPGDELRFQDGFLRVNGRVVPWGAGGYPPGFRLAVRVPEGSFFALGDHASVSYDSRSFGPVPLERIQGRVLGPLHD